jgi:3-deoxy-D-manno-octulosonate 8-phosphate phosphatase (KDO 8-P phosphatase)
MIKMLIMDVDGTLTDGKIYISSEGEIMKAFSVKMVLV